MTTPETPSHPEPAPLPTAPAPAPRRGRVGRGALAAGVIALSVAAGALGASYAQRGRNAAEIALDPVSISGLAPARAIAVRGEVKEIYGNKFVIQDPSGRALVETGPAGDGGRLVAAGEPVTVQGRFENGFMHARLITRSDGRKLVLAPPAPLPPGIAPPAPPRPGLASPAAALPASVAPSPAAPPPAAPAPVPASPAPADPAGQPPA